MNVGGAPKEELPTIEEGIQDLDSRPTSQQELLRLFSSRLERLEETIQSTASAPQLWAAKLAATAKSAQPSLITLPSPEWSWRMSKAGDSHDHFHLCMVTLATAPERGFIASVLCLTASLAVCALQLIVCLSLIQEGGSRSCDPRTQTGCYDGEFCSNNKGYANKQCDDCSQLMPATTTCCPSLEAFCTSLLPYPSAPLSSVAPSSVYNVTFFEPA